MSSVAYTIFWKEKQENGADRARNRSLSKTSDATLNVLHKKEQENDNIASLLGKQYSSEEDMEREVELRVIQRLQKQEKKQFSGSKKQNSNEIVQSENKYQHLDVRTQSQASYGLPFSQQFGKLENKNVQFPIMVSDYGASMQSSELVKKGSANNTIEIKHNIHSSEIDMARWFCESLTSEFDLKLQVAKLEAENKALNDAKTQNKIANFFNSMFKK